ncbi:unnamed protein product [Linum trigynum]|uniref:Integrase catalytic domain-containing protein n=1 Tax=Linum trigynum TaxID=586398 RepID=A0AAV2FH73_9ROSI
MATSDPTNDAAPLGDLSSTPYPMEDPYFLHSSEQPGSLLVSEKLTATNYNDWSRAMFNTLAAKNKLGFLNGVIPEPAETDPKRNAWVRNNIMILSWIQQAVESEIRKTILSSKSAAEAWKSLQTRYGSGDIVRVAEIEEELCNLKQGTQTITEYYSKVITLRDELDNYQPLIPCACSPTSHNTCPAMKLVHEYHETSYVIKFLRGLNENFSAVRSQFLFGDALPDINRVFQRMLQHERQLYGTQRAKLIASVTTDGSALAIQGVNRRPNSTQKRPYCVFCKRDGHTEDVCFVKHGYPPGMSARPPLSNQQATIIECTFCGKHGHSEDKCFKKHGFPANYVPRTTTTSYGRGRGYANSAMTTHDDSVKLTKADYDKLMALVGNSKLHPPHTAAAFTTNSVSSGTCFLSAPSNQINPNHSFTWILDTGASDHIVSCLDYLVNPISVSGIFITLPTGQQIPATYKGTVPCTTELILQDALFVPGFSFNLVSVSKLTAHNSLSLTFHSNLCVIQDLEQKRVTGSARLTNGLYYLEDTSNPKTFTVASSNTFDLWHFRLGHLSHSKIPYLHQFCTSIETQRGLPCDVCHFAKQRRLPFPLSQSVTTHAFELLHVDIWGPNPLPSYDSFKYFLTIVDDFSRMTWVILLQLKSEARPKLIAFCNQMQRQFQTQIKRIRSDQGKEFEMNDYYDSQGIIHEMSCVETPQQNSKVERKHQHILAVARALKFQADLPPGFWSDCIKHAVYLINRVPSSVLNNQTPHEKLHNSPPDLTDLRVFGCLCYASSLANHRTKFQPRARKGVFLGYKAGIKGYKIYDLDSHDVFVSRDVIFYESHFPFKSTTSQSHSPSDSDILFPLPDPVLSIIDEPPITHQTIPSPVSSPSTNSTTPVSPSTSHSPTPTSTSSSSSSPPSSPDSSPSPIPIPNPDPPLPRRSDRSSKPPAHLTRDYHCYLACQSTDPGHSLQQKIPDSRYGLSSMISYDSLTPFYKNFVLNISSFVEPTTYTEASKSAEWNASMQHEIKALLQNQTWDVVELPPGKKPIGNKWVYRIKVHQDGTIERFKSRVVAKGYTQQEGVDYQDTFAPVVKMTTIGTFLAIAALRNWHIHQLDVNNAFLHGDLQEEVYMTLPKGYKPPPGFTNPVCRLKKSLYGLKQASRQWFSKLTDKLQQVGYSQSRADHSLFYKVTDSSYTCILIYVDDLLVGGNDLAAIQELKGFLHSEFSIKDLGVLRFFLGMEVARNNNGIHLSQRKYALEIIEEANLLDSRPVTTPMDYKTHLTSICEVPFDDPELYRTLVGKLIYLTTTRPDISFATQQVSQFMGSPSVQHFKAVQRILRYLKCAPASGLFFPSKGQFQLKAFSDSDWAACIDTRRSITGYCVYLGDSLISWKSKKQQTVSRSSCEAEYRALAFSACELQWILYLLHDFQVMHPQPAHLYCDNQSAIYIADNPTFHERTKHIELDCHLVRDKLQAKILKLFHVSSNHQLADLFTKPLSPAPFLQLLSKLGVLNLCPPACGGVTGIKSLKFDCNGQHISKLEEGHRSDSVLGG